jgi:hypothetical protein
MSSMQQDSFFQIKLLLALNAGMFKSEINSLMGNLSARAALNLPLLHQLNASLHSISNG